MTAQIGICRKSLALISMSSLMLLAALFNEFYLRFDTFDFSNDILELTNKLLCTGFTPFDECSVANSFKHSKARKSPVPDNISSHLLSSCAEQLAPIFH